MRGGWDERSHSLNRSIAQDTIGLSARIANDLAPLRIFAGESDACHPQGPGIRHRRVAIHSLEKHGMISGDLVNVPASGHFFHRPKSFVPASAYNPFPGCGRFHTRLDSFTKFSQRLHPGQIYRQTLQPALAEMHVSIVESRHDEMAFE